MKNEIRKALLISKDGKNTAALRAIEIIERYTPVDFTYLLIKHLYKDTAIPYDFIKGKGLLAAARTDERLAVLNTLPDCKKIIEWILNYCRSKNEFTEINFDTIPMDKFLGFAEIFNSQVYDDINALLFFEEENKNLEFSRAEYGQPDIYKNPVMADLDKTIQKINEDGVVLEVQKPKRALFHNIVHITPEINTTCHVTLKSLAEKNSDWFEYTVVTKKSDKYERLYREYPIEVKAFEEILSGQRPHFVRTDEPDYTTPFLKSYEFTEVTYCHLSELGKVIYRELKEELAKKIPNNHEAKRTGLLKTDFEEMRHSPNYSVELEAMHKKDVTCSAERVSVASVYPDCIMLLCEDAEIKPATAWSNDEANMKKLLVEIDTTINLPIITRIHNKGIKLYGTIEYQLSDEGSELGLHVKSFSLIV